MAEQAPSVSGHQPGIVLTLPAVVSDFVNTASGGFTRTIAAALNFVSIIIGPILASVLISVCLFTVVWASKAILDYDQHFYNVFRLVSALISLAVAMGSLMYEIDHQDRQSRAKALAAAKSPQ